MRAIDADVFPLHWTFASPVGWGTFDPRTARVEDLFDAWVLAAEDARLALEAWSESVMRDRCAAYLGYLAALEREERAAAVLAATAA
jgi:hypothetical protein